MTQSTPVFLPGESHGQKTLVGYSTQGPMSTFRELDMTEASVHACMHNIYVCVCVCVCVCISKHTYTYLYVYIYSVYMKHYIFSQMGNN